MSDDLALIEFAKLIGVMRRLRSSDGCAWDRAQTFATIAPYTIEEAYEVADAIADDDMPSLCDELGDLALQVVYHAQLADESGHFTLADVLAAINAKMIRRHPHVFAEKYEAGPTDPSGAWERLKAAEKPRLSAIDGVASALPALMRAQKLQAGAARAGFNASLADVGWIEDALDGVRMAPDAADAHARAGDLLLAVTDHLRRGGIDAETALRDATRAFDRRVRRAEATTSLKPAEPS